MKVLVTYYSRSGTTRKLAEAIAAGLGCEIEAIEDTRNRGGPFGFLLAGADATMGRLTRLKPLRKNPADYDLVAVGSPVWAGTVSTPIRTYLTQNAARLPRVAFFLTGGDPVQEKALAQMAASAGKQAQAMLTLTSAQMDKGEYNSEVKSFVEALTKA
jgi:flavodoxin